MTLAAAIAYCALSALAGLVVGLACRTEPLPPAVRPAPPEPWPDRATLNAEVECLRKVVKHQEDRIVELVRANWAQS